MAKEVVTWCDPCLAENDEHVEAVEATLMLPGMKTARSIDLCSTHWANLIVPLQLLADDYGKDPAAAVTTPAAKKAKAKTGEMERKDGPYYCRVPNCTGYNGGGYASRARLRAHLHSTHQMTYPDYEETYGPVVAGGEPPTRTTKKVTPDADWTCAECGKDYSEVDRPAQALGAHRSRQHGVRGERHGHKPHSEAAAS